MKYFKYSLVASAMALVSVGSMAATYQLEDLGDDIHARHSYGMAVNAQGTALANATEHFNQPIDLTRLNIDAVESTLNTARLSNPDAYPNVTIEDIENGNLNAESLDLITIYLNNNWSNRTVQKIGDRVAYKFDDTGMSEVTLFDVELDEFGGKTRSVVDIPFAINDNGATASAGTDVYLYRDYVPAPTEEEPDPETIQFWRKNFIDRYGVVNHPDGVGKTVITGHTETFGGSSVVNDISNNNYVVGFAAVQVSRDGSLGLDSTCPDEEDLDRRLQCSWQVQNQMLLNQSTQAFFRYRAYRWKLDENYEIVERDEYGLLFESDLTESNSYFSAMTGVNEQGNMSGYSHGYRDHPVNEGPIRTMATFHDGENYTMVINQDDYFDSRANDINDNNIIVGYATSFVNSRQTRQLFYYDHNTGETVHPDGFFNSSASEAKAINNSNQIVGHAEVQTDLISNRRAHGFIFDVASQTMTDLNDLIGCNSPYRIVEANDINDEGVIVGTALLELAKKDSAGNPIVDSAGNEVKEQVTRAIRLTPIAGGSVDDCDSDDDLTYERKGAGMGWLSLLIFGFGGIYRRLVR